MTILTQPRMAVPPRPRGRLGLVAGSAVAAGLVALHVWAWLATDFSLAALASGWDGMVSFLGDALPPDLAWNAVVRPGIDACLVTFAIGLMGTTLSIPTSLALAVLGARTTSRNPVIYQAARSVMSFLRAVPDIVFALVFVTAVGLGPFAGVLALICHNTGVMSKLWSESMEEIDSGPIDALRVAGASSAQIASHVVLPSVVPQFVGLLLYRLDVNVRSSLVLGLVGAGGVGFLINQSISLFRFDEMMTYILMVLVMVVAVDLLSGAVRKRLNA
ncbi:phosphonate ABC transporter, permease protein PhnE [Aeromicrobium chenweiae]|uniref:Phosphonate ABC transporter, permease protein PhnE n=1 Tax=Aeromicrobium chenweiae TaxID=2079793 RepID=A0A2S0WP00_9ACTN|nr:phosphonate ABC transporter, permease protein PhnE [Aeromicrobium chenweiae]AWB93065.1 phosphonate ABC transporter, permease protein PhnE [Aeromicrobium chenweiae]TGN34053.1 phosphonate ABC transporter, permease protein PhnE [Aeromicrobium chenweiae]